MSYSLYACCERRDVHLCTGAWRRAGERRCDAGGRHLRDLEAAKTPRLSKPGDIRAPNPLNHSANTQGTPDSRTLITAFLTFLPNRTVAIKASSHSTGAVSRPISKSPSTWVPAAVHRIMQLHDPGNELLDDVRGQSLTSQGAEALKGKTTRCSSKTYRRASCRSFRALSTPAVARVNDLRVAWSRLGKGGDICPFYRAPLCTQGCGTPGRSPPIC